MKWEAVLGIFGVIASIAFAYLAFSRNKKVDDSSEGKQNGIILTEIGYIKGGIDDIKMEQREQRKVNTEVYSRLSAVEASSNSAHKRIDRLDRLLSDKEGE